MNGIRTAITAAVLALATALCLLVAQIEGRPWLMATIALGSAGVVTALVSLALQLRGLIR